MNTDFFFFFFFDDVVGSSVASSSSSSTAFLMRRSCAWTKSVARQVPRTPARSTNLPIMASPRSVWRTSGWNWRP